LAESEQLQLPIAAFQTALTETYYTSASWYIQPLPVLPNAS
jgi:hypothetical protein